MRRGGNAIDDSVRTQRLRAEVRVCPIVVQFCYLACVCCRSLCSLRRRRMRQHCRFPTTIATIPTATTLAAQQHIRRQTLQKIPSILCCVFAIRTSWKRLRSYRLSLVAQNELCVRQLIERFQVRIELLWNTFCVTLVCSFVSHTQLHLTDDQCLIYVQNLIDASVRSQRTFNYDVYQYWTNAIVY